jgi:hypothetical protein
VTLLFGGHDATNFIGDTWEWDGTNWMQRSPATSPPARYAHSLAYDVARNVTILFGGYNFTYLGDTWEWDGTGWTQHAPATSPPGRLDQGMAYDAARGVAVMFGGYVSNGARADTWEWNGTNWTQRSPAISPPARYGHALTYDTGRGWTLLFGGYNGNYLADTFEYFAPCGTGDFDGDGAVTLAADLPVFVSMLLSPPTTCTGDMNHDGVVDGRDISLFVAALLGQ